MAETVTCPGCKKKYAVKPELAGKRAKCKCGEKIQFPAAATAAAPAPAPNISLEARDDKPQKGKSAIFEPLDVSAGSYDLAGDSKPAPAAPSPAGAAVCSNCKKPLTPGAVICMICGFNQKTGSAVRTQVLRETAPVPVPARGKPAKAVATSGGPEPLSGLDWVLIILCNPVAFIMGLIRGCTGKGWSMFIASIVVSLIATAIRAVVAMTLGAK